MKPIDPNDLTIFIDLMRSLFEKREDTRTRWDGGNDEAYRRGAADALQGMRAYSEEHLGADDAAA